MTKAKALTEEQWLASDEPYRLLRHLQQHCLISRMRGGKRRQRLLACASCHRAWHLLAEAERRIVGVAERAADGLASRADLAGAEKEARAIVGLRTSATHQERGPMVPQPAHMRLMLAYAVQSTTSGWFSFTAGNAASSVVSALAAWEQAQGRQTDIHKEQLCHADLVRDIFRNPFRQAAPFDRPALALKGSHAERVARTIYDEHRWDEMPVLADALEEAGCADADLLGHCRSPALHARGCWAVDLILGVT